MQKIDNEKPKVSVITACLNGARYLEDAIKSLFEQTYPNIEYIVIDGGSTDGSIDILNKYRDRISKVVIEKDSGIFNAMNKGIGLASGEIVYFLNSDDKFYDNKVIETAVGAFINNKEADFIYGNIVIFDAGRNFSYVQRYPKRVSRWLFIRKTIGHPATFFRSSCFVKSGYFEESYSIAADYEWYLRALYVNKLKSFYMNINIAVFRLGGISTNAVYGKLYFSERKVIEKRYFNIFELACSAILTALRHFIGRLRC